MARRSTARLAVRGVGAAVPVTLGSLLEIGDAQPLFHARIEPTTALTRTIALAAFGEMVDADEPEKEG